MSPVYRTLDANRHEIRLLKLLGESDQGFDSPIRCELIHRYLDNVEQYEALTYSWGEKGNLEEVHLDDHPVKITKNLEIALRYLRRPDEDRILWVDALCINQDDIPERSHQVSLMKDVYQQCTRDIAWLGPIQGGNQLRDSQFKTGVDTMLHIVEKLHDDFQARRAGSEKGTPAWYDWSQLKEDEVRGLRAIFSWPKIWTRVWVMQELSCAPSVTLVHGHDSLDWSVVSDFLNNREYADAFHMPVGHGYRSITNVMMTPVIAIEHQRGIMRDIMEKGRQTSLLDVLARFKDVYSTEPRDRVYGLLGLVTEEHDIHVDYSRPVEDVFAEVTLRLINSLGSLDIICQNPWHKDTDRPPGLESWIADFADEKYIGVDPETGFSRLLFAQRSIFSAGRPKCAVPVHMEGRRIRLRGTVIGKLGPVLHEECHGESNTYDRIKHVPRDWMLLYFGTKLLDEQSGTADELRKKREVFARTLVMDCNAYHIRRLPREEMDAFRSSWDLFLCYDGPEQTQEQWAECSRKDPEKYAASVYAQDMPAIGMWYRNRDAWTFCLSEYGLHVMVRRGAREGDVIAVLDGAKVPVILREVAGKDGREAEYVVVCAAYVHGFMDGEAVRKCDAGLLTERDFLLA